jgi:hypothetical protein
MLLQDETESWSRRNHVHMPFRELVAAIQACSPLDEPAWIVRRGDRRKIVARFDNETQAGEGREESGQACIEEGS